MAKLMLHRQILKDFHRLPSKVQKRVSEWIEVFQKDPYDPSIGLHSVAEGMADPKVRGAELPGGYRAIIIAPEKGDTYLLVYVDAHDKAYHWARNKRFEVHEMTGLFQIFDAQEVQTVADDRRQRAAPTDGYPLSKLSDEDLFNAGVPKPLIAAVKAIHSDEALTALSDYLPPDCRDVLFGIAAGLTLDQAFEEMLGVSQAVAAAAAPDSPGDFTKLDKATNFDLIQFRDEEELKSIFKGTLEEWRIFLHPYQRKLVEWQTNGPMNISGSAGTGKTVALMHRAVYLAKRLENAKDRVLVTTFTTNLSVTIKHQIQSLSPSVADRIEVTNLHSLARTICSRSGWKGRIAEDEDIQLIWDDVWLDPDLGELPMTKDELRKEYDLVIDPNGIDTEDAYLTTVRSGRPRISRDQRRRAWPVFRAFQRGLKKRSLLTFEGAIHEARLAAEAGKFQRFAHVLVDEVQDFSLEALRLIRAISPVGEGHHDPLCVVGDGHQRIYRTKVPLSRAGIDIRGRSRRLKINYRTSEQIRKFAQGILKGLEIDDLDGGTATTLADHSVFKGPEPMIERCKDRKAEAKAVVAWAQMLLKDYGLSTHELCVVPYKPEIRSALSAADIPTYELKPREEDPGSNEPGVRMGTMKRIKGLEFRAVAMACADPTDPMNQLAEAEPRDRCERYVAATRAREHLLVSVRAAKEED
ncbi:MAG: ATP-dependent helicase [Planctomycetes bacterium]|nr:ATP-dependent helicase [Planctomycetota bacterium]